MIKYFCDKCGKELFIPADIFTITIEPPETTINGFRNWLDEKRFEVETRSYVLCYDCIKAFNKWMNKKDDFTREAPKPDVETLHIPDACKSCSNHPSNGGSGICNCTLGTPQATC